MTVPLYNLTGEEHTYESLTANCDCETNKATMTYKRWTNSVIFLDILPSTCPRRHTGHCECETTHWSLRVWEKCGLATCLGHPNQGDVVRKGCDIRWYSHGLCRCTGSGSRRQRNHVGYPRRAKLNSHVGRKPWTRRREVWTRRRYIRSRRQKKLLNIYVMFSLILAQVPLCNEHIEFWA